MTDTVSYEDLDAFLRKPSQSSRDRQYIFQYVHNHLEFRLPETLSLASLYDVSLDLPPPAVLERTPFFPLRSASTSTSLRKLVERSFMLKAAHEYIAHGRTLEELLEATKARVETGYFEPYLRKRFKFKVETFAGSLDLDARLALIKRFAFIPFTGAVDMHTPDVTFYVLVKGTSEQWPPSGFEMFYLCRHVADGQRDQIDRFNLKKRQYIGITSMDAELSLIMSNMAKLRRGDLVYDPFLGTGSFLNTTAYFGTYVFGSDIDGRQMRGKGASDIFSNAAQYQLERFILGGVVFDLTCHPWRTDAFLDAIITDPPYGVRAGARRIAHISDTDSAPITEVGKYPKTEAYPTEEVMHDLVDFAARFLRLGGRLVYWQPSRLEELAHVDLGVPSHPCMRLVAVSEQPFNVWSRALVTMEKTADYVAGCHATRPNDVPFKHFHDYYFHRAQFRQADAPTPSSS